jgi:hypothetical protein
MFPPLGIGVKLSASRRWDAESYITSLFVGTRADTFSPTIASLLFDFGLFLILLQPWHHGTQFFTNLFDLMLTTSAAHRQE